MLRVSFNSEREGERFTIKLIVSETIIIIMLTQIRMIFMQSRLA